MQLVVKSLVGILMLLTLNSCSSIIGITSSKPMAENPGKRSWGSFIDDEIIETKALVNIAKAHAELKKAHITIASYNGVLLIAGQVPNQKLKALAGKTAKKIRKVRRVHNELTIAGPSSRLVRMSDQWLTTKIKTRMAFTPGIPSRRIKVVTENGVIYMQGLVSREQASRAVAAVQKSYGVQKIVKMFEYIGEGPLY